MRIVIDMQGAQTAGSRFRGIGRYTMAFTQAILRHRGEHEVILALSGLFPEAVEPIRIAFHELLPQENIKVWYAPNNVSYLNGNEERRRVAEFTREAFLSSLNPDVVLISSLFEGPGDDAVTSISSFNPNIPTAVILYDLIPFIYQSVYLNNPVVASWYRSKIEHLKNADMLLSISESSRQEGIEYLDFPEDKVINISTAITGEFQALSIPSCQASEIRQKYHISKPFVMYTGGIDFRKNIEGLIRAYAKLSKEIRIQHQLVIVCFVQKEDEERLIALAKEHQLEETEVILTGFIPEDDLVILYNLCKVFVFPSWHEGFGLPALEAMACGSATIGSNSSSIPEVIGRQEALFESNNDNAITEKLNQVLVDSDFRHQLEQEGLLQAKKFSWDKTAMKAISALEALRARKNNKPVRDKRPRLAYISPLPPERSGISSYSVELLPALAKYYRIDVIIKPEAVSEPWIQAHCGIYSVEWFQENHQQYDRVLYHFGNSQFHEHMFELLEKVPGVVVLHDFYLSGIYEYMEAHGGQDDAFRKALYYSHGYQALEEHFHNPNTPDVIWAYPCNLSVIQNSLGMIAHSRNSPRLAKQWYGSKENDWKVIPHMRNSEISFDKEASRKMLGYRVTDFIVCAFGGLGPTKLNQSLLEAWLNSSLADDKSCHLIFAGENPSTSYENELVNRINNSGCEQNIHITGWLDADSFRQYLAVADLGVQLRTLSRGETSGAVLDCMNYSLATIVNANGAMADLDSDSVWILPENFSEAELTDVLETLRHDSVRRKTLGEKGRETILQHHSPEVCATMYYDAIEHFYTVAEYSLVGLMKTLVASEYLSDNDERIAEMAKILHNNFLPISAPKQLLIDVSALVHEDFKTGIQRVVRSILVQLLKTPPDGYRVEPVYSMSGQPYRYAQCFTQQLLEVQFSQQDDVVDFSSGDILLVLDFHITANLHKKDFYHKIRGDGVNVYFVVYDLLYTLMPHFFPNGQQTKILFEEWLEIVAENNGAVCISKSVANELNHFLKVHKVKKHPLFQSSWFHLGADIENSVATQGLPENAEQMLNTLQEASSFLMVGTIEPRKGHEQVLDAFEQLWQQGVNVTLVLIGKEGWMVKSLVRRIRKLTKRYGCLFWLESISDEYLGKVYATSDCLIAASYDEGFGLPLIEAARHGIPIIARDIPVFKEVAGNYAYYFEGAQPQALAATLQNWLALYEKGEHPKSNDMPWLTWEESTENLLKAIGVV